LSFRKEGIDGTTILNNYSAPDSAPLSNGRVTEVNLSLSQDPIYESLSISTERVSEVLFDGIACKNDRMTLKMLSAESSLAF
jgi:hypothetical protein